MKIVWCFDRIARSGVFAFDTARDDFNFKEIVNKMISYNSMTWGELKRQTHDRGKSKHHFLDPSSFSDEAKEQIARNRLEDEVDDIFSFALQNTLRVIGLRKGQMFHVVWYDPYHQFAPSTKR